MKGEKKKTSILQMLPEYEAVALLFNCKDKEKFRSSLPHCVITGVAGSACWLLFDRDEGSFLSEQ